MIQYDFLNIFFTVRFVTSIFMYFIFNEDFEYSYDYYHMDFINDGSQLYVLSKLRVFLYDYNFREKFERAQYGEYTILSPRSPIATTCAHHFEQPSN